jgi:hypothetical protein
MRADTVGVRQVPSPKALHPASLASCRVGKNRVSSSSTCSTRYGARPAGRARSADHRDSDKGRPLRNKNRPGYPRSVRNWVKLDAGSAPAPDAANSRTTWLSTVNEDGSPHVTAVGALWVDGAFWFQTGTGTRKGRNVARDPRCSIAVSIRDADVVIEGDATRVTEPGAVARIAKAWADSGWPAEPDDSGPGITAPFNAPSQGPPPWNVYRIEPRSAIVVLATEPGGLTRFRF